MNRCFRQKRSKHERKRGFEGEAASARRATDGLSLRGFEPRSPRPQRGILTTKLQRPQHTILAAFKEYRLNKNKRAPSLCSFFHKTSTKSAVHLLLVATVSSDARHGWRKTQKHLTQEPLSSLF